MIWEEETSQEKLKMEAYPRRMVIKEEEASQQMWINVTIDTKAQVWYQDGTSEEGVEQDTFSSCKETMTKNETNESRVANAISSKEKCFGTRIMSETSSDEGTSMSKACMIKGDKKRVANMIKEIVTKNGIELEVAKDESMADGHVKTFSTLVLETWAIALKSQRETQETEGGGEEVKAETNTCEEQGRIIEACSIKRVNGYEADESKEIAMGMTSS